jgi:hypothetical protein
MHKMMHVFNIYKPKNYFASEPCIIEYIYVLTFVVVQTSTGEKQECLRAVVVGGIRASHFA